MPTPMKLLPLLRGSPLAFPLAALAALIIFVISETSYQQASTRFQQLGMQATARVTIQTLWRSLLDAETGQRGYLLTNRKEYLKPYVEAQASVTRSLDWLTHYYSATDETKTLMNQMAAVARNKLAELAETNRLHDEGKDQAWRDLMLSNIGAEQMDAVRALSEQLIEIETAKVDQGRESVLNTLLLNRIGVTAMVTMSLLAFFMYLRQTTALVRLREEQRRIVQAERDLLGIEVRRRTGQLTELARHLQTVREDERNHLARELHDELGALLTSSKLDVARLKSRLGVLAPDVAERLQHLNEGLNSGIALKRRIIEDLRPSSLSNLGLVSALEILVREWGERSDVVVESEFKPVRLRRSGELTVYRLVQEALTNISKYAMATEVQVRLRSVDGVVHVAVGDNGVGFDVSAPRHSAHGLLGMRYRLETEGGNLTLKSSPGQGTWVQADIPESSDAEAALGPQELMARAA